MSWHRAWKPYVPVAKRRARAEAYAKKLAKSQRRPLQPIEQTGRKIATTFWGQAWCDNLERYSDFASRLPRGRTYVRNGSVIDLQIQRGRIAAIVSGSDVYRVTIDIQTLTESAWRQIKRDCSQAIASLMDLLQGRFDQGMMRRLTQREGGLFPRPQEITMRCTCPDWAKLCKHVAATLYGVGTRLDAAPELLFTLRDVDHLELVGEAVDANNLACALAPAADAALGDENLAELFGIDLEVAPPKRSGRPRKASPVAPAPEPAKRAAKSTAGRRRTARSDSKLPPKGARRGATKSAAEKRSAGTANAAPKPTSEKRAVTTSASAANRKKGGEKGPARR